MDETKGGRVERGPREGCRKGRKGIPSWRTHVRSQGRLAFAHKPVTRLSCSNTKKHSPDPSTNPNPNHSPPRQLDLELPRSRAPTRTSAARPRPLPHPHPRPRVCPVPQSGQSHSILPRRSSLLPSRALRALRSITTSRRISSGSGIGRGRLMERMSSTLGVSPTQCE